MKKILGYLGWVGAVILVGMSGLGMTGKVWAEDVALEDEQVLLPELYIKAINPGYTVDGKSNVGEMIEIARREGSDTPILLTDITIGYTNSSGNDSILMEFPENSYLVGDTLLLRLASSPEGELAEARYTKTLAFKGGIQLMKDEEVLDKVCWTSKEGCYREFKSANPTVLVRNMETGIFEHVAVMDYVPEEKVGSYVVKNEKPDEEGYGQVASQCKGVQFSEILSYYETSKTEQFIEFYNYSAEQVLLDGCMIRYKNKNYVLSGIVKPEEYFVYRPEGFNLTKNPTNGNLLELIDVDGVVVDSLNYPNGQRKATAYALIGFDGQGGEIWRVTYAVTPGSGNVFQEFKTCEDGKVINEQTGNCVKVTTVAAKICPEGQYLNILTGRCRKSETATEKKCKEGYYLNEETGRCRKIVENKGAEYSVEPEEFEEEKSFVALYAVIGVLAVGVGYLVYEFRHEIARLWHRVFR